MAIGFRLIVLLCGLYGAAAAAESVSEAAAQGCIRAIIAADDRLGRERNHAPESGSLDRAVNIYIDALQRLDFAACPPAFKQAFAAHIEAWRDALPVLARFPALRGEMHTLFEQIKADPQGQHLIPAENAIWSSWAEVEAAMRAAGVEPSS